MKHGLTARSLLEKFGDTFRGWRRGGEINGNVGSREVVESPRTDFVTTEVKSPR